MDWNVNPGNSTTQLTRLDWDLNTGNSTTQSRATRDTNRKRPSRRDQPPIYTCSCHEDTGPRRKGEEGSRRHRTEQPPPCGKPVVVAPLQSHTPSDRVESSNPDLTPATSQSPPRKHNARGPRHTHRWTPPRSRRYVEDTACGASPLPPQHSVSWIRI